MKELKRQSLQQLQDLIHGESYNNIRARLKQHLPDEYAKIFANVKIMGSMAMWYTDDDIAYRPYAEASAEEREDIAICLEECREVIKQRMGAQMTYVDTLFMIPSRDYIYWYVNPQGQVAVTLTAWGFCEKGQGPNVDVIGFLIQEPRVRRQQEVTIHIQYTDGEPAAETEFVLNSFNNEQRVRTDKAGNYFLGKIYTDKTFSVASTNGANAYDFVVQPGAEYVAVFDRYTSFELTVVNQFDEPRPGIDIEINGMVVRTDINAQYVEPQVLLTPETEVVVSKDGVELLRFRPQIDPEENKHVVVLQESKPEPEPEPPVEPERTVTVILRDYDGDPLPDLKFDIYQDKKVIASGVTDAEGRAVLPAKGYGDKQKYRIAFRVTKEYRQQHDKKVQVAAKKTDAAQPAAPADNKQAGQ